LPTNMVPGAPACWNGTREWSHDFILLLDTTRLGILAQLAKGPKNITALCKALGLKQPTVSHHLGLLRMGRLVAGTRKGKAVEYSTDKANLKALAAVLGKLMPK
jgi:DNA-binding transcriptional ArsR family regulator